MIELYAGDTFSYTSNVSLSNSYSWNANAVVTSLDLNDLYFNNTEIGILNCNLSPIVTSTPNSINYTLTLSSPSNNTINWISNSVNISERVLYLFTQFTANTSNTQIIQNGNTQIVRVKAAIYS
jgi:hypothetical protein